MLMYLLAEKSLYVSGAQKYENNLPINTTGGSEMGQKCSIENDLSSGHNLSQKHTFNWSNSLCCSSLGDYVV